MSIEVRGLSKRYGKQTVLNGLDLSIARQSFTVICGPTGAGKSALLRLLVGLEQADAGAMLLNGTDISKRSAAERAVGYVPQSFALYPHLTVRSNIGYPLKLAKKPSSEIAKRVDWAAGILAITHLLDKTPDQLSGGEKQRTAVARGLLKDADIFLLDDPLVGLDYKLRERLMDELKGIQREIKATFLYATSDSLEALTMAEQLVVLDDGQVVQQGDVFDVYRHPRHVRAMEIVGFPRANLLAIRREQGDCFAGPFQLAGLPDEVGHIGLRPEALIPGGPGSLTIKAEVKLIEDLGGERVVYVEAQGHALTLAAPAGSSINAREGDTLEIAVDPAALVAFSQDDGQRVETQLSVFVPHAQVVA
jgi:ABC-type sugar transport system ATPase subunit